MTPTHLTHLPLDKMAAVSQTIFSYAFSWMKSFIFWLKFDWSLLLMVHLTITPSIGLDDGLAPNRQQPIIWTNADPIHRTHICGTRGRWVKQSIHQGQQCRKAFHGMMSSCMGIFCHHAMVFPLGNNLPCLSMIWASGINHPCGLLPHWHPTIIWINDGILLFETVVHKFQWHFNQNTSLSIQEDVFENVVCKMAVCFSLNVLTLCPM